MPFVQRAVGPVHLSRVRLHDENGVPTIRDRELDAVTNCALSNALRQMASVAALADEVFRELRDQLADVATRSAGLKRRVQALGHLVDNADPKAVTVPESDLTAFSLKTEHFKSKQVESKNLLLAENRPIWVKRLYDQAGVPSKVYENKPHVHRLSRRKRSLDDILLPDDIELRKPAAITNLRPWTSEEVLGDITVAPDCSSRIPRDPSPVSEDQIDHKLPSPEEQQQVIALKFPPQIVEVDVSGRSFNRMSALRRSLQNVEYETSVRRRKSKRPRGKRRNTIAGTDQKELEAVIGSLSDSNKDSDDVVSSSTTVVVTEKKSNLDILKDWGRMRLKQFKNIETASSASVKLREKGRVGLARRKWDKDEPVHSSSGNWSASSESGQSTSTSHIPRSSVSSCSGSTKPTYHGGSSVTSDEGETGSTYSCDTEGYYTSFHVDSGLKTLREEDPPQPMSALHSTSALTPSFQSSSAESEYDVFGRGSTSTTASSAGTVCTSLMVSPPNVPERGGSKLSERSADIAYGGSLPDRNNAHGSRDPMALYDKSKTAPSRLTKENVTRYKEEGLMIDVKPRPCLEHGGGDSPDSGHNTCSSPVDSVTNPSVDLEMSECSDLEGVDRVERLRVKTTINTSRIPSMCVITPPMSDDEVSLKTTAVRAIVPDADDYGEYVTLAHYAIPEPVVKAVVEHPEQALCKGFVHLDELPAVGTSERQRPAGARVTLNAEGRVIYSSDSLKRRKKTHTVNTFEPGPCVNANVRSLPVNNHTNNSVLSQAIPRSPLNVRPVTRQPNGSDPQAAQVIAKKLQGERNSAAVQLKPLVPIPLPCSPGQRRSGKTIAGLPLTVATALNRHRVVVLPDNGRCAGDAAGKPVSPLISPTRRSLSPKEVVRGAYVRMQDPTECLETSLDEIKSVVKRSDSYRQANATSPRMLAKSPNMLMALQKARSETTTAQGNHHFTDRTDIW
uniref:Wiskott-Aldrich syndrome protein family member 2 n=1 Tax=Melanaphis sacchari TaxID=742174 RepID=A0A2H8TEB6_9HEMI